MGVSGNFYIVNEAKLRATLEKKVEAAFLHALDKRQWQAFIYYLNALDKYECLDGFEAIPKKSAFNRTTTQTIGYLLDDKTDETHRKYEAGYFIEKANLLAYLDFMLALCKYFYETKTGETIWELYDVEISEEHLNKIQNLYELEQKYPPDHNKSYVIDFGELAYKWKMFFKLKTKYLANEIDFLVFYHSY